MVTQRLETQALIVGAGPVGLMLAGELRRGGVEVLVLEQRAEPTTESRASTLHSRTMEIFEGRGLVARLGGPPQEPMGHFAGLPLDLTLRTPFPGQWKVPQTQTEEVLGGWADALGADIQRGHEVRAIRSSADQVEAVARGPHGTVRVRSEYLIGCDGEHSTVRRLTGALFPGHDARMRMLRADVAGIDIPNRRFQRLEKGLAIAARRGDGVTRVMVHELGKAVDRDRDEPDFADVCQAWANVTGEDIHHGVPLWVNEFDDTNRQLSDYRHGRVLFAGDAAHRQLPTGGQALNLGLQDAVNLGWKLAAQIAGTAPDDLLDSYHTERHAVGQSVLANIEAQAHLLFAGAEVEPVRGLLAGLLEVEEVRVALAQMVCGLDIRYDVGANDHCLLGARLPHAALATESQATTTTALAGSGRGMLLDLRIAGDARFRELARPWAGLVDVIEAQLEPMGGTDELRGIEAVLTRPDGHVVWIAPGPAELSTALTRWFGAAR